MNVLGIARFRVLAVSGGGPYALALAWALPDRVERVALLSSPGSFDIPGAMDGMARAHRTTWRLARWQPRLLRWLVGRQLVALERDPEAFMQALVDSMHGADREALEALGWVERRRFMQAPLVEALRQGPSGAVEDMRVLRAPWGSACSRSAYRCTCGTATRTTPRPGRWLAGWRP